MTRSWSESGRRCLAADGRVVESDRGLLLRRRVESPPLVVSLRVTVMPVLRRLTRGIGRAGLRSLRPQKRGLDALCRRRPIQSVWKAPPGTVVSRVVSKSVPGVAVRADPPAGVRPTRAPLLLLRKRGRRRAARGIVRPRHHGGGRAWVTLPFATPRGPPVPWLVGRLTGRRLP